MKAISDSKKFQLICIVCTVVLILAFIFGGDINKDKFVVEYTIVAYDQDSGVWVDMYTGQRCTIMADDYGDMLYRLHEKEQEASPSVIIDSIRVDSYVVVSN